MFLAIFQCLNTLQRRSLVACLLAFGREVEHDMFHGKTCFCDHIFAKNQVSMGAGETIAAKNEFET